MAVSEERTWVGVNGPVVVLAAALLLYFCQIIVTQTPGTILPDIQDDIGWSSSDSATISAIGTAVVAISKMTTGPLVDLAGGRISCYVSLLGVVLAVGLLSDAQTYTAVTLFYALNMVFNAPLWPAVAVLFKETFDPSEMDRLFRMLAISSRLGSFTTFGIFAPLLEIMDWRGVCLVSVAIGLGAGLIAGMLLCFHDWQQQRSSSRNRSETEEERKLHQAEKGLLAAVPDDEEGAEEGRLDAEKDGLSIVGAVVEEQLPPVVEAEPVRPRAFERWKALLKEPWYLWALGTMAGLMCVTNQVYLISTFFSDTAFGPSPQYLGLAFPGGLLACVLLPGALYVRLSPERQRVLCLGLQLLSFLCAVGLAVTGGCDDTEGFVSSATNATCGGLVFDEAAMGDADDEAHKTGDSCFGVLVGEVGDGGGADTYCCECGGGTGADVALIALKVVLVFFMTFGLGVAYYIPLHAASVRFAPNDAGLCNSTIDGAGYIASVLFQTAMKGLLETALGWQGVWALASVALAWSIFAMDRFFRACAEREKEHRGTGAGGGRPRASSKMPSAISGWSPRWFPQQQYAAPDPFPAADIKQKQRDRAQT